MDGHMGSLMNRYRTRLLPIVSVTALIALGLWWCLGRLTCLVNEPRYPLRLAMDAYASGNYKEAEAAALRVRDAAAGSNNPEVRERAVEAQSILAYSAARRKDFELASERFEVMRKEAARLPDKGKQEPGAGYITPTLEEDAAYQRAVCTAAMGDKKAAEAEYLRFIREHPDSSLIYGAIRRVERLHDGKLPKEAEKVFMQAKKTVQDRDKKRLREQSMCGPDCLAELLRRRGEKPDVKALAKELGTNENGTSLKALADTAGKHGYATEGLSLTWDGLHKQPVPLVALLRPGHYVIVNNVGRLGVTVWDPNGAGLHKPSIRRLSPKSFTSEWTGIALVLKPEPEQ